MVAPAPLAAPTRIVVTIPGVPGVWSRARVNPNGAHYTDDRSRSWKEFAKYFMLQARAGFTKFGGPLVLEVDAYWPRPKRPPAGVGPGRYPRPSRPDWDNVGKILSDAANEVLYADDAQIVRGTVTKWIHAEGESPRVEFSIAPFTQ